MNPAEHAVERVTMAELAVQALAQEYERLKADCVEAMELLRAHGQAPTWIYSTGGLAAVNDWNRRYGELLLKHKEAT